MISEQERFAAFRRDIQASNDPDWLYQQLRNADNANPFAYLPPKPPKFDPAKPISKLTARLLKASNALHEVT